MHLDLDALSQPAGTITLHGVVHDVRPIDGYGMRFFAGLAQQNRAGQDEAAAVSAMEQLVPIVARLVPTVTVDDLGALRPDQLVAIIRVAAQPVEMVEGAFPNGLPGGQRPATPRQSVTGRTRRARSA